MEEEARLRMQLQCPVPKTDFEYITLGHGSGGLLTNKLLETGVFDILKNDHLDQQHDGAFLNMNGNIAMTTDSFVISPIFFPGGNIGELAVNGTVNDLAMCGAVPSYLSLAFIIEEGFAFADFWEILLGIKWAAEQANVQIVTGDTKVVDKGKGDKIYINTTGIGQVLPEANIGTRNIKIGDHIICSGQIATHGMAIMSVREGLEFESPIRSDTKGLQKPANELIRKFSNKVKFLRDPTRGGLGTSLAEVAKGAKFGIHISQDAIPIDPTVHSACELLGLDPLYVANEGVFMAIVDPSISDKVVQFLRKHDEGIHTAIIGEIVNDHPGKAILRSSIGGQRVINLPIGEQLPRIC